MTLFGLVTCASDTSNQNNDIKVVVCRSICCKKNLCNMLDLCMRVCSWFVSSELKYTKPPECVDIICRTSQGFHRGCPGSTRS